MDTIIKTQIIDLIHREVIPAIGCTEPIAVALAAAKAAEVLGRKPEKIEVYLSANILKNAMGVGIPGTGMVGLPIAIALGSIIGKSAYGLEVLKDLTSEGLKEQKTGRSSIILSTGARFASLRQISVVNLSIWISPPRSATCKRTGWW